jgi:hypothetical protein
MRRCTEESSHGPGVTNGMIFCPVASAVRLDGDKVLQPDAPRMPRG